MYDIHCHILHGIDDGPDRLDESIAMARMAAADGTRTIIATPHEAQIAAMGGKDALALRIQEFSGELQKQDIRLEVVIGAEYVLTMDLLDNVRKGEVVGLSNSRYLLVELNFLQYPHYTDEAMFQLQLEGFTPVLAHPERQVTIQEQPELVAGLVERGVITEVTGGSITGDFGRDAQRSAHHLLTHSLVHIIASDGHTAVGNRPPVMSGALNAAARLVGDEAAQTMVVTNPRAILDDGPVKLPTARANRRGIFHPFGRR